MSTVCVHMYVSCWTWATCQHLDLTGVWMQDHAGNLLCDALRRMPQLCHLSVPQIANGHMLEVLSRKCAHLKTLDLSGAYKIFDEDLLQLTNLGKSLQLVNLTYQDDNSLSPSTVARLINGLPHLGT